MGNIANYMIQIMTAHAIASHAPGAEINAEPLPEWDLHFPADDDAGLTTLDVHSQRVDVRHLGGLLASGEVQRLNLLCYAQHIGNFLDRAYYQRLFDGRHVDAESFSDEYLVINIRAGEILDARHPFYTLLPIAFYRELIASTGLVPVFMGQIGDDPYCRRLREAFPAAIFRPSRGVMPDFETIRRSVNVVPSVSTFSWLASWLGDAKQVFYPLSGLLNPIQTGDVDLFPAGDARYRPYLFPINYAIDVGSLDLAHKPLEGLWREISHEAFSIMRRDNPRFAPTLIDWSDTFVEAFYLTCYPDVRTAVDEGWFPSGRDHFMNIGVVENRAAFYFDGGWYSRAYPLAALEVAQGDFQDLRHHYAAIGRKRGYKPSP